VGQQPPPWGYGDSFDESSLPPQLKRLAERVKQLPGLRLGALRDVTINYRHNQFYRCFSTGRLFAAGCLVGWFLSQTSGL